MDVGKVGNAKQFWRQKRTEKQKGATGARAKEATWRSLMKDQSSGKLSEFEKVRRLNADIRNGHRPWHFSKNGEKEMEGEYMVLSHWKPIETVFSNEKSKEIFPWTKTL